MPIDGAPVWVRALQATIIGIIAGVGLSAILSMVVVQGRSLSDPAPTATPTSCNKQRPAKEAVAVPDMPAMSRLTWTLSADAAGL